MGLLSKKDEIRNKNHMKVITWFKNHLKYTKCIEDEALDECKVLHVELRGFPA